MTSLSSLQYRGVNRMGDVLVPGNDRLPSFSESRAIEGIDRMLPYMNKSDRDGFLALAAVCGVLPAVGVRAGVALAAAHHRFPEPLAAGLRMANLGMKGVVHSLYWSDLQYSTKGADDLVGEHGGTKTTSIHALLGYDPMINTEAYERHLESKEN